jgi:hypothetical protein
MVWHSTMQFWQVGREWAGETVFIVAGGPSVLEQDLESLRGARVIVINSSVFAVPWADILFFGDWRWWNEPENRAAITNFAGRVVTTSRLVTDNKVLFCKKTNPPGLATARDSLMQKWTSLTAATNLAAHLIGPGGMIVWLGADGKASGDRTHHHKPHRWPIRKGCYDRQYADLKTIVPSLAALGITAFNASPGTAWVDLLPQINLADVFEGRRAA